MGKLGRLLLPLILLLLMATPALAQGSIIIRDDANRVDDAQVQRAAEPLVARGARVAIYAENTGQSADFRDLLEQDGLISNGLVQNDLIAVFVSLEDRHSEIIYGDNWKTELEANNAIDNIRTDELNAGLSPDDFTNGFVNALEGIDQAIERPATSTGTGTTINNNFGNIVPWCVGLIVLLVGGPAAYQAFNKRRTVQKAYSGAQQAYTDARKRAGAAIADLGQLFRDAREKAQFDQVSYPDDEVQRLSKAQSDSEQLFVKAQERFDSIDEGLKAKQKPTQADYESSAAALDEVVTLAGQSREQLEQVAARRMELDRLNAAAPGDIDRAKKALADAAERLGALSDDFGKPDAILRPADEGIARAETLFAAHRAADASAAAGAASAIIAQLAQWLARYSDIREGLSAGRAGAQKAATQGYRVDAGLQAFDRAEALLKQAAAGLERGGLETGTPILEQAEAARAEGVDRGGRMPALRAENDARLPDVEQAGRQLAEYIEQGRQTFDIVDEFAESTWSDIRGNGSEAQAAAGRAQALWERANQRNSMEQQDFLGAKQDLDAATGEIGRARALIDTVIQRLKDLETARSTAKQEIAAAQADIQRGWEFVRSRDTDIGAKPEQALRQAEALLQQAQAEIDKPKPDWLALVKLALQANSAADQALDQARGEAETIAKLRDQVAHARQLATAEVQKTVQFASLHRGDIDGAAGAQLNDLQGQVQSAYTAVREAEQREDKARGEAYKRALAFYAQLEDSAQKLYGGMYESFQRVEALRAKVDEAAKRAEREISSAETFYHSYASYIPANSEGIVLLNSAKQALGTIGNVSNEAQMKQAIEIADEARKAADRAERVFRSQIQAMQRPRVSGGGAGDFIAGAIIGSLLDGDRGHHGGGSGWGGGWGSGGGSSGGGWGGGGSSGGSWGGGGSSGGSWGGGGGSGGGW